MKKLTKVSRGRYVKPRIDVIKLETEDVMGNPMLRMSKPKLIMPEEEEIE